MSEQVFMIQNKFKLLDIVSKSTPDYLPADKSNKDNKYVLYEEFVLGHTELTKRRKATMSWYLLGQLMRVVGQSFQLQNTLTLSSCLMVKA